MLFKKKKEVPEANLQSDIDTARGSSHKDEQIAISKTAAQRSNDKEGVGGKIAKFPMAGKIMSPAKHKAMMKLAKRKAHNPNPGFGKRVVG